MEFLKDQYPSDNESKDKESDDTVDLPALPSALLDKFHVSPNIEKLTAQSHELQVQQQPMNSLAKISTTQAAKWTSFAFLEMRPTVQQRRILDKLTCEIAAQLQQRRGGLYFQPLHMSDLGSPLPLHVSLSANLEFGTAAEVDAFEQMLRIEVFQRIPGPFQVDFEPFLKVYENAAKDALFLALGVRNEQKNGPLRQLWQAVHESLDFCRRTDPDEDLKNCSNSRVQQPLWGHERSHMSISKAFVQTNSTKNGGVAPFPESELSTNQTEELNRALMTIPVDPQLLENLSFQCTGVKVTKQRSNVWIPFPSGP
ncbi:LAFA_0E04280g1_1 [Lachancea sp. 'fantastica']|nr:LAFA_0E04280g1_1 [Lachancea sp. 'fantastica']